MPLIIGNLNVDNITLGNQDTTIYLGNTKLYEAQTTQIYRCVVSGLGSENTSSVTFSENTIVNFTPEQLTQDNITFVKFPTFYRKVNTSSSSQITSFTISTQKEDSNFEPYSCFVKEDGTTVMPYILIAVDTLSSTSKMADARTTATNYGSGYQLYDWQIHRLFQDLAICKLQTIDTNSGSGITTLLGVNVSKPVWLDGIARNSSITKYLYCYSPSHYVSSVGSTTANYQQSSYGHLGNGGYNNLIKKLGYYTTEPFFNFPSTATTDYGTNFAAFYCDRYSSESTTYVNFYTNIGGSNSMNGVYHLQGANYTTSTVIYGRVCYRPI